MSKCLKCKKTIRFWSRAPENNRILKDGQEICSSCLKFMSRFVPDLQVAEYTETELKYAVKSAVEARKQKANQQRESEANRHPDMTVGTIKGDIAKHIKTFEELLTEDEMLKGAVRVSDEKNRLGGLYLTNKRIVCICSGFGLGTKTTNFPLSRISSIDYDSGFMSNVIEIHVSGNSAKYNTYDTSDANKIVGLASNLLFSI